MSAPPAVESLPAPPAEGGAGAAPVGERCAVCGTVTVGPYCHACGERRPRSEDESLGHFLREQFHEVTSADGKLWRTVRALFVPGKLTEEYFSGRRGLYVRPIRLFLVLNVLFFLWTGWVGAAALVGDARVYRGVGNFSGRIAEATAQSGVPDGVYDAAFSQRARVLAPSLIGAFIPAYAFVFALVLAPARRPFARHAVFATHFVAVFMASAVLISTALTLLVLALRAFGGGVLFRLDDSVFVPLFLVLWSVYLVVGVRRVYDVPWWGAGLSGLISATLGTLFALEAYRTVLFYATLWTVDVPLP